jgi:hypothetical protein
MGPMTIHVALAPLVFLIGLALLLFGNATAQKLAVAPYWLGLAFTLYELGSKFSF